MGLKSKFAKKADDTAKKAASGFVSYLDLQKYNLEKFKFQKEDKDYLFDILPYKIETDKHPDFGKAEYDYHFEIYVHTYIGANKGSYLCMKKMFGKECACCEEYERLKEQLEDEGIDREEVWKHTKNLYPQHRILYHIRNQGKTYLFDVSFAMFEKTWKQALDKKKKRGIEYFPVYLNEEGCTSLEFSYRSKGKNFYELINYDFPEIEDYDGKIVEGLVSLEKLLIIPDQEILKNELAGLVDESEEQEEEQSEEQEEEQSKEQQYFKQVVAKDEDPKQESETEEIELPAKKKKKVKETGCPYGTIFGQDWDEYEHCDKCQEEQVEKYEACKEKYKEDTK